MPHRYLLAVLCLALGLLAVPRPARADALADDEADLEIAKTRFHSGQYEEAASKFDELLKRSVPKNDPRRRERLELRSDARPYYAASLVGMGRIDEADEVILVHLRNDPFYELPPGQFPGAVQLRFIEVTRKHHDELEKLKKAIMRKRQTGVEELERIRKLKEERMIALEKMAEDEKIVEKRSRIVAMVPFGVGQFQNDNVGLGVFFLTSEVATITGVIVTAAVFQSDVEDFVRSCTGPLPREQVVEGGFDCDASETKLQALRIANWVSIGSAFALIVAGIIEAQVSFKPQIVTRHKRKIPPRINEPPPITIEPAGGASDTGFFLGVQGRF